MEEWLVVGKLLKARGLKGEIGVQAYSDDPSRFFRIKTCRVENEDGSIVRPISVTKAKIAGNKIFLQFEGVTSREAAEVLTGSYLSVPRAEAVPLEKDSWFNTDLQGCEVFDTKRGSLGTVSQVLNYEANDVLEISKVGEKALYLPLLKSLLLEVKVQEKKIFVDLPPGLYEIYRSK